MKAGRKKIERIKINLTGLTEKISQSESKRAIQILMVLDYLHNKNVFSIQKLVTSIKVSRDSIDRTINKLKAKGIVKIKKRKYAGGNVYQIQSKSKLKQYKENLQNWEAAKIVLGGNVQKGLAKAEKSITRGRKKGEFLFRLLTKEDLEKQLKFASKQSQQRITKKFLYPRTITINNLPCSEALRFIQKYSNGSFCETCFEKNTVSFLTTDHDSGEEICEFGHVNNSEQLSCIHSSHSGGVIRKRSPSISDSEFKAQRDKFLRGKKRKSKTEDDE